MTTPSPRYERYKEALRRGHVAALRGRPTDALAAYAEAAGLAPDRALPHVGQAGALRALGRAQEALEAYGRALARNPADEGGLQGRATILVELGRGAEAADDLTRLATHLEAAGRWADAHDAVRRAIELSSTAARRAIADRLAARLHASGGDGPAISALGSSLAALGGDETATPPDAGTGAPDAAAARLGAGSRQGSVSSPAHTPNVDPEAQEVVIADALASDDRTTAAAALLTLAETHRAAGRPDAAMEACLRLLGVAPADGRAHALILSLQIDRGWRTAAAEKARLLARLAELDGDEAMAAQASDLAGRAGGRA